MDVKISEDGKKLKVLCSGSMTVKKYSLSQSNKEEITLNVHLKRN